MTQTPFSMTGGASRHQVSFTGCPTSPLTSVDSEKLQKDVQRLVDQRGTIEEEEINEGYGICYLIFQRRKRRIVYPDNR